MPATRKLGPNSLSLRTRSAAVSTKLYAVCSRITWSFATARSPTIIRIRRLPGMAAPETSTARPVLTRMPSRTRRSLRRTDPPTSRESTSCERCPASILAYLAVCTCIWAAAKYSRRGILRCLEFRASSQCGMKGFFEDASMTGEKELQQLSSKIEDLVHRVDAISDPAVKANATVLVQSLLDVHSAAFERVTEALLRDGEPGRQILERLATDEIVGGLLVLYGLHPDGLDVRLQKAIERARKAVAPHGASVELLAIREGEVHLRLSGKNAGCGSTTRKLQELVENAIGEAAPEI